MRSLLRRRWLSVAAFVPVFCLLWLNLFSLPLVPVSPSLDSSWCGAMVHFAALKLQFGREVIFTYGPLAHLISFVYTGELFTARVIWELISKTVFTAILCSTIRYLPAPWRPVFFLFVLFFIWIDAASDALFFLVVTCLAAVLFRGSSFQAFLNSAAGALLGVCSLIKFNYLILAVFSLTILCAFYLIERTPRRATILAGSFILTFLISWVFAGQAFSTFPVYLTSSLDISFGYKEAMGIPAGSDWVVATGLAALLLGIIQCGLVFLDSRRLAPLCIALFFAGTSVLSWTRAFVRADDHVLSFFGFFPLASLAVWVAAQPRPLFKRIGYALNVVIFALCFIGISFQRPNAFTHSLPDALSRITRAWRSVTALPSVERQLRAQLVADQSAHSLPRVRAEIGDSTIDVVGYEQGIALLNGFNYTPRPVFQGYSAYTRRLIEANTAFYSSARAPMYVLFKYQPIDERYPTLDDAGVLLQLLLNYVPLFDERGYSLWKRVREPKPLSPAVISTKSILINEICEVPAGQNVWVELELPKSLRGRLRSLLYKPPPIEIRTNDPEGRQLTHRLIPSMSASGFIINPQLYTPRQLLESAIGGPTSSVTSFLIDVPRESRRYLQRRILCRIATLPGWPAELPDGRDRKKLYHDLFGDQGSELELAQDFQAASEVILDCRSSGFAGFTALNQSNVNIGAQGVQILATGSDPALLLPPISLAPGRRGILRIEIEAPEDTGLQLFYLPSGVSAHGEYRMDRFVRRGKNTIYFALSDTEVMGGRLRLDPGMVAGNYLLADFELRLLPPELEAAP